MGQFFNYDILPWLLKGTAKLGEIGVKAAINEMSKPNIDDASESITMLPAASLANNNSTNGFVLGVGIYKDEAEDGHIMVVGGVGSGKSSCIAIPSVLSWKGPVFAIDIKGELCEKALEGRISKGLYVFDPLKSHTAGYDPYYLLRRATNKVQEAQAIAHALIPLPPNTPEPYWIQSAQNLFAGTILHFSDMGYSFIQTVTAILDTKIMELIEEIYTADNENARRFVAGFMDMKSHVVSSILTVLSNHIMIFATDESIKDSLSRPYPITPEFLESGGDIFVCIPDHMLKQWKNLLTLMVSQFLTHFEKRPDMEAKPILFLLDEFARLGKMEGIVDGLATLRSKKITIAIILQSLAQLDLHYGKEARQVIADTCQYKAVLNITDVDSQEYFSKAVGTYEKIKVFKSQQYDRFTKFKSGSSVSTMTEEKPLIKPHEFATLEQIVLLTPNGAYKLDKKPYYLE